MAVIPRSHARRAAVQALYHGLVNEETEIQHATLAFVSAENAANLDQQYFEALVAGVSHHSDALDNEIKPFIDRALSSIDPVESTILRLAVYEFLHQPDIPYRVILNEAVELAKAFGSDKGHKYVNGVLDKVGAKLRQVEYQAIKKQPSSH